MKRSTRPIPTGFHTITPHLVVKNCANAIDFYKRALGAKEINRMPGPDGRLVHAEIQLGDSRIFLSDEFPEMGSKSPQTLNGSPVNLFLYVEDVDSFFKTATEAGGTGVEKPTDMFWGDRWATVKDPYGHVWQIATHIEDVTPQEMERRSAEFFAAQSRR
jgi:PhnB protein